VLDLEVALVLLVHLVRQDCRVTSRRIISELLFHLSGVHLARHSYGLTAFFLTLLGREYVLNLVGILL